MYCKWTNNIIIILVEIIVNPQKIDTNSVVSEKWRLKANCIASIKHRD